MVSGEIVLQLPPFWVPDYVIQPTETVNFRQRLSGNCLIFLRIKTIKKGSEIALIRTTGFKFMMYETRCTKPAVLIQAVAL
jgi:hypothetical protein